MTKNSDDKIPEKDLKDINDSFKKGAESQIINKTTMGSPVSSKSDIVNSKGYIFKDFRGKTLKHNKSVIPVGGKQTTIGTKGQKFNDIPEDQRKRVTWFDSDFE